MKNWKIMVLTVLIIWAISFLLSNFFKDFSDIKLGNKIAVIPIYGEITLTGTGNFFDLSGTSSNNILDAIQKAEQDPSIKGILLEINSPGGTVVASEEIADAVKKAKKPVVSWIREEGASGAYWIASSSDKIVANPLSITGSIGVLASYLEFSGLLQKYGVTYEQLTAGSYKDLGTPFKKLNETEKNFLQEKINKVHDYFINQVAENRNLSKEQTEKVSNGAFYLGLEAKDLGLVDILGNKDDAVNELKKMANIKDASLVVYQKKLSFFDVLANVAAFNSFYIGKGISYGISEKLNSNSIDIKT